MGNNVKKDIRNNMPSSCRTSVIINDLDRKGTQKFPFKSFKEFMEFDERMPIEQLLCAELVSVKLILII